MRKLWMILLLCLLPAAALAEIPGEHAAGMMYPGYTLANYYDAFASGDTARAEYYRITDGLLYKRTVRFSFAGEPEVTDFIPVPVTPELADFMAGEESAEFRRMYGWDDALLTLQGYEFFDLPEGLMTADGLDRSRLPVEGEISRYSIAIHPEALIILTNTADAHWLYVCTRDADSGAYELRRSGPWPATTILDRGEPDGVIQLSWHDRMVWFDLQPDGEWRLSALQDFAENQWALVEPEGLREYSTGIMLPGEYAVSLFDGPAGDALFAPIEALRPPVTGRILDLQGAAAGPVQVVFVLTEEDDARYLWVCETSMQQPGAAWDLQRTQPLPPDTVITALKDGSSKGDIVLEWDFASCIAQYARSIGGDWYLKAASCHKAGNEARYTGWFCGPVQWVGGPPHPGTFKGMELFSADLAQLFESAASLDSAGWATVEAFFALLYTEEDGEYLCRLWQGTPLRVLQQKGVWCQVELGDGGLTGWTYSGHLAFGERHPDIPLLPDLSCVSPEITDRFLPGAIWPVGETEDGSQAILLTQSGMVLTCPSSGIQPGNG